MAERGLASVTSLASVASLLISASVGPLPRFADGHLEAYTGAEPVAARSEHFGVRLEQGPASLAVLLRPMVYATISPDADLDAIHEPPGFCSLHGRLFCNRSISWVEFGQDEVRRRLSAPCSCTRAADA